MKVTFHPEADEEFQRAIDYYEEQRSGLGTEFNLEVYAALGRIEQFPYAWPALGGDVRRCLLNRFPYGVLYSIEQPEIFVLAIMHSRRDPDYWKHRA